MMSGMTEAVLREKRKGGGRTELCGIPQHKSNDKKWIPLATFDTRNKFV